MSWTKTHILIEAVFVSLAWTIIVIFQSWTGWDILQRHSGNWSMIGLVVVGWLLFIIAMSIGCFLYIRKAVREFKAS